MSKRNLRENMIDELQETLLESIHNDFQDNEIFDLFGTKIDDSQIQPDEDNIYNYIVNIEDVKLEAFEKAKKLIRASENSFKKENIVQKLEYKWLNNVITNLYTPRSENIEDQRNQITEFIAELKSKCFKLETEHLPNLLPENYSEFILGFDTETTGLDTRTIYDSNGNIDPKTLLVGISIAATENEGWYLPVRHNEEDGNLNWNPIVASEFLTELNKNFCLIIHNAAYDRQVLALNGTKSFRPFPYFFDTQILYYLLNTDGLKFGLKPLSKSVLNREMIDIWDLFEKQESVDFIRFDFLPAENACLYACSDATNTLFLFKKLFENKLPTNPLFYQPKPVEIDHKFVDNLIVLYRQGFPVDTQYAIHALKDLITRVKLLTFEIYKHAGKEFDIASGKQLSTLIFDELQIPPLPSAERNKLGYYPVAEEDLLAVQERNPDVVFLKYCVLYRKLENAISKFYTKFIKNSYVDCLHPYTRVCLSFSQTRAQTGRLASSSNGQLEQIEIKEVKATKKKPKSYKYKYIQSDGTCGYNSQGVPGTHYKLELSKVLNKVPQEIQDMADKIESDIQMEFIKSLTM